MIFLEAIKSHGLRKENNNSNNDGYHMKWQTSQLLEGRVLSTGHCGEPTQVAGWRTLAASSVEIHPHLRNLLKGPEACLGWYCTPSSNLGC